MMHVSSCPHVKVIREPGLVARREQVFYLDFIRATLKPRPI